MTESGQPGNPEAWPWWLTIDRNGRHRQTPPEWARIRNAAARARLAFPGAVGELVARELGSYAELGWLLQPESLPERVIGEVLGHPAPSDSIDTTRG